MKTINISCFGAIRPLKNHLLQAEAAIAFADMRGLKLRFHMNGTRKELGGEPIKKNIIHLFENTEHELVMVDWLDHPAFLKYIKENIDIGMQVSFTETYNIVAADHVQCDVPIITSPEVVFVFSLFHADPTSFEDMVEKLNLIHGIACLRLQRINAWKLRKLNMKVLKEWETAFDKL